MHRGCEDLSVKPVWQTWISGLRDIHFQRTWLIPGRQRQNVCQIFGKFTLPMVKVESHLIYFLGWDANHVSTQQKLFHCSIILLFNCSIFCVLQAPCTSKNVWYISHWTCMCCGSTCWTIVWLQSNMTSCNIAFDHLMLKSYCAICYDPRILTLLCHATYVINTLISSKLWACTVTF